ncbi:MAG: hypothetical protein N2200_02340 [Bacteroidia bacterium]|nr:hypothetical protein [Bacteroidia bacterium]
MFLLGLLLLCDSLPGISYEWKGLTSASKGLCTEVLIKAADRILLISWQESTGTNQWTTLEEVRVDRGELPKSYQLCRKHGRLGQKVRIVLSTLSKSGPRVILYEGYPWGEPPSPPIITLKTGKPSLLYIDFPNAGKYIIRAFNRFGEEIFTIPLDIAAPQQVAYTWPPILRGTFLIRLYDIMLQQVVAEKTFAL